jgi:ubiquinone/menaquinone biosynthesis C-methylase UbiE
MDLDDEAVAYAEADFTDVNDAFIERLLELAGPRNKAVALDLGCGPGDIPMGVLERQPGWRVIGLDASFAMLRMAREAAKRRSQPLVPILSDAKRCPFPNDTFDVVFSNSILHHVTEVQLFWAELARISRAETLVFLRDLARPDSQEAAHDIVETYSGDESSLLKEEFYRSLLAAYTVDEVCAQLAGADLKSLQVLQSTDRHLDVFGRPGR